MRTLFLAASASLLIGLNACKTAKPIAKAEKSTEIEIPFSEKKYKSDKNFLRANHSGTSPNLATSKKIAVQNAKSELAGNLNSLFKSVTEQYINQSNVGSSTEYKRRFESLTRDVTKQSLSGTIISEQRTFKNDMEYTTWISLELSKSDIIKNFQQSISKDEQSSLEFDKAKFELIFNEEMSKND